MMIVTTMIVAPMIVAPMIVAPMIVAPMIIVVTAAIVDAAMVIMVATAVVSVATTAVTMLLGSQRQASGAEQRQRHEQTSEKVHRDLLRGHRGSDAAAWDSQGRFVGTSG